MGVCSSALTPDEELARSHAASINSKLKSAQKKDDSLRKLLLLGAGESGKSTLFKQTISLYGAGFTNSDRIGYRGIVHNNVLSAMQMLIHQHDVFAERETNYPAIDQSCAIAKAAITSCDADKELDDELARYLKALWADKAIQATWSRRAQFQIQDTADYFFDKVMELRYHDYVPIETDILCTRVRTTGILETQFSVEKTSFSMVDVGGQRTERKKWIHCFENVTSVIFVAAISEYDQTCWEDERTNRMLESLQLFEEICNSRWFLHTPMILFLNKRDLFQKKIKTVPLTVCFDDYDGKPNDYDEGIAFLQRKFESKNKYQTKEIYTHVTCATDADNIQRVFQSVRDIVIRANLRKVNLIE